MTGFALKALRFVANAAVAPAALRACDQVGRWTRTRGGLPVIDNHGRIAIGARVVLNSMFSPVILTTGDGGTITIGDRSYLNFGCIVDARHAIRIGGSVSFGPYCVVRDAPSAPAQGHGEPIEIGDGVWLAARVTVLPGARIGAGSVVTAGSVVSGEIPAGVVAGGNPARILRALDAGPRRTGDCSATLAAVEDIAADDSMANGAVRSPPATEAAAIAGDGDGDDRSGSRSDQTRFRALVIADFTVDGLADRLADDPHDFRFEVAVAPFEQVVPSLLGVAADPPDLVVVWTLPETAVPSFRRLKASEPIDHAALLAEVDSFADVLIASLQGVRTAIVPTWTLASYDRGLGTIDLKPGGRAHAVLEMNRRLTERLGPHSHIQVLDTQRWVGQVGRAARHPKLWYVGKVAFSDEVFDEAVADIKAAFGAASGRARKLIVVDLDDTMWGGIVGDAGWENLRLGGHDSVGEAFVDFQRALKSLKQRGILLAIASKNEADVALDAIRQHTEMILRENDFAAYRINWFDKAQNISEIANELNLGLQSVVFLDDNPVERARVREALPEVFVPEWPVDKHLYASRLLNLTCFDTIAVSAEDLTRTEMMHAERRRDTSIATVGSVDEWVASLGMQVRVAPVSAETLSRTVQLLNKTNQMNLTTRRLTEAELIAWTDHPNRDLFVVHVSDKYGDSGLTGVVSLTAAGEVGRIVDYVLSCRVMGRKVEETLLHVVVAAARLRGLARLEARLIPTAKNKPCLSFWKKSGFSTDGDNVFGWDLREPYPLPNGITLESAETR